MIIQEGKVKINVVKSKKISKKLSVFYNPVMELNRTVSVLVLNAIDKKDIQIALPLAGSGVRGLRFLKELKKGIVKRIYFNDISEDAVKSIKDNLKLNRISSKKVVITQQDANLFLLESQGFDYIDVDPFGSPNIFLDSAVKRLGRAGILAVTATDTGCLAGSFPKACQRKYWAIPQRNETMHENGLRILIRKVQLIGADHSKALTPIFSYSKDHYLRVFFKCEKGKKKVDEIIKKHGMFNQAGPLWLGELWDQKIVKKIVGQTSDKFLRIIEQESKIPVVGFYNLPRLSKQYKFKMLKQDELTRKIRKKGYEVAVTHFAPNSIRSDITIEKLIMILRR